MTFQTLSFIALLLAVFALYWLLGRKQQNLLLLVASYVFYGYVDPLLTLLLAGFTLAMYFSAISVRPQGERSASVFKGLLPLWSAIAATLLVIAVFKYLGFFVDSASDFVDSIGLGTFSNTLNIILPIGISFYTLQGLGYVIDVHQGRVEARRNLLDFALFISFFPQLVAGPIERAARLLPQFESKRTTSPQVLQSAVMLILWGFFKKLVIADNVGVIADRAFATESPGFALIWVGVLAFGLQIFADFSGYTDIARGTARLFGINLSQNFRHPHMARSPADFWRRWHVSLSTWFRDYVYIPLGGSRTGQARSGVNLMATFLLSGLWHGASWNFALWGGYHGTLVYLQRVVPVGANLSPLLKPLAVPITFVLVSTGWLFFRESSTAHIWGVLTTSPLDETAQGFELAAFLLIQVMIYSIPIWLHTAAGALDLSRFSVARPSLSATRAGQATLATLFFTGILVMRSSEGGEFIYFQF